MRLARPPRRWMLARSSALWGALSVLVAGCDFPEPRACALACGPAGECPGTFECQPDTLLCAPRGMSEPCTSTVELPSGAGGVHSGGEGGAPPDAGAASPSEGPGGEPGDAGGAPTVPASGALAIELARAAPLCAGVDLALELEARGGEAPYVWRLLDAPAGVSLAADGASARLAGVPEDAGLVLVALDDGAGRRAVSGGLAIYPRPVILTSSLPAVCSGARYRADLDGWGGDVDSYVWSAQVVADEGAPALDELGLEVVDSSVMGASPAESDALGPVRLRLALHDEHCDADEVELDLDVAPRESDACPSIAIVDDPGSGTLPRPCRGNRYGEALTVEGGEPPFTWTELSTPPGLYFDVDTGRIEGVAEQDGQLEVAVTDGGGRTVDARYEVRPRDQCWLAYVAGGIAPARLNLVDARLLQRQPDSARRVLPAATTSDAVSDFRFSPDGRFIAYRLGPAPDALRIELLRVSDAARAPLELSRPVSDYAWSGDSTILFVATGDEARALHGIDVTRLRDGADDELVGARLLTSRSIPLPGGPLVDFGARAVAFLSPDAGALRLVTAGIDGARVAAPSIRSELDFSASASVVGTASGAVVSDPATGSVSFFPADGGAPVARADVVPSSSGTLAASALGGILSIFDATTPSSAPPLSTLPGCDRVLAWSREGDRLACFNGSSSTSALAFFQLGPSGLVDLGEPGEPEARGIGELLGVRRTLSASGRWFAVPDERGLSVWLLDPSGPRLAARVPSAALGAPVSSLAFSPAEDRLLVGSGNRLGLLQLGADDTSLLEVSPSALLDDGCSERSVDALQGWCGSDSGASALRWSSGADVIAFRSALGALNLADVSEDAAGWLVPFTPDPDCDEACLSGSSARFQP